MPSVVGVLVFTQFWFWFPLSHFLSLAYTPTCVIGLNKDLKVCLQELSFIEYLHYPVRHPLMRIFMKILKISWHLINKIFSPQTESTY